MPNRKVLALIAALAVLWAGATSLRAESEIPPVAAAAAVQPVDASQKPICR